MSKANSIFKFIAIVVVIFIAAAGGMYLGGRFNTGEESVIDVSDEIFQKLKLKPGFTFPEVDLLDRMFKPVSIDSVLHREGTVILFMDPQCPPCQDVAEFWQAMISDSIIEQKQVVGICFFNASQIEEIYLNYGIDFPVYADENYVFINEYGVDAYPLTLVVDKFATITYSESDSNIKPSKDKLMNLLSGK